MLRLLLYPLAPFVRIRGVMSVFQGDTRSAGIGGVIPVSEIPASALKQVPNHSRRIIMGDVQRDDAKRNGTLLDLKLPIK